MPKLAIITSCYNVHEELLYKHFQSIEKQDNYVLNDSIHIIVDDASTDSNTRAALLYYADRNKHRTVLISKKENTGPGATRNRAIELIKKMPDIKYICLLDADDYLEDDSLLLRFLFLEQNKEFIGVYGNKFTAKMVKDIDTLDDSVFLKEETKTLENVPEFDKARLFRECYIPSCSIMFRAEPFIKHIKSFREDVRLCEDWLIWRKLALLGKIKKINASIYTQTLYINNLTLNKNVLANHARDMMITQNDLENWINDNPGIINLC